MGDNTEKIARDRDDETDQPTPAVSPPGLGRGVLEERPGLAASA
jgi:hypothetical protein